MKRTAAKVAGAAGLFASIVRQRHERRRAGMILCVGLVPSLLRSKIDRARATKVAGASLFVSLLREREESVRKAKLFATGWLSSLMPKRGKKKKNKVNRVVLRFEDVEDIDDTVFADMGGDGALLSSFLFPLFPISLSCAILLYCL
tara:strand:- start:13 stop:450 length:438 start_codon:yes stop_codon:yes gene_type:complete